MDWVIFVLLLCSSKQFALSLNCASDYVERVLVVRVCRSACSGTNTATSTENAQ